MMAAPDSCSAWLGAHCLEGWNEEVFEPEVQGAGIGSLIHRSHRITMKNFETFFAKNIRKPLNF
jgi:hypothetical protein